MPRKTACRTFHLSVRDSANAELVRATVTAEPSRLFAACEGALPDGSDAAALICIEDGEGQPFLTLPLLTFRTLNSLSPAYA